MEMKIGVIGTGAIGAEHIKRVQDTLSGAYVRAVYDVNATCAQAAVEGIKGARVLQSADEVIADPEVDAIILTSASFTHEEFCLKAIAAGKPVFVEKPLAVTVEGARRIVDAEMAGGRKLVQVGFMRRYDRGYMALKQLVDADTVGTPLIAHCAHRNPTYAPNFGNRVVMTDTVVHEIDVMQWLMNDYFVKTEVVFAQKTQYASENLNDPQIVLLTTSRGKVVIVEAFVNCQYGYDIQCEIVGEKGTARLPEPEAIALRREAKRYSDLLTDWKDRFIEAYDIELQDWVNAISAGRHSGGPDAWDGYCATVTAEACVKSQQSGKREPVALTARPDFYL